MYKIHYSSTYRKSFKRISKSGKFDKNNRELLENVIKKLQKGEKLDAKHKDHELTGYMIGFRECHIQSDFLLIYKIYKDILILDLINLGSHSDLF